MRFTPEVDSDEQQARYRYFVLKNLIVRYGDFSWEIADAYHRTATQCGELRGVMAGYGMSGLRRMVRTVPYHMTSEYYCHAVEIAS